MVLKARGNDRVVDVFKPSAIALRAVTILDKCVGHDGRRNVGGRMVIGNREVFDVWVLLHNPQQKDQAVQSTKRL